MSSDTKKILIALPIILVIGYFVYSTFFATPVPPLDDTAVFGGTTEILGQDILIMVEKLRGIAIDKSVFSGAALTHLQDFSTPITSEPQGRSNPFIPLVTSKSK